MATTTTVTDDTLTLPDLLPRIAEGDPAAVGECLERYGRMIWSMARRTLANPTDAEDAVQDVFIKLWKNADRFDPQVAPERTFITMLTRRCLIDHQRKRSRSPNPEPLTDQASVTDELPIDDLEAREETDRMIESRPLIGEDHRRILELKLRKDWSYRKIAEFFNLPIGTVKSQARRGMIRIRELLAEAEPLSHQTAAY